MDRKNYVILHYAFLHNASTIIDNQWKDLRILLSSASMSAKNDNATALYM